MKLAGAKAILRLSRHWDHMIPIDLFYLTLKTSEVKSMTSILNAKRNTVFTCASHTSIVVVFYADFNKSLILSVLSPDKIDRLSNVLKLFLLDTFRLISPKLRDNF